MAKLPQGIIRHGTVNNVDSLLKNVKWKDCLQRALTVLCISIRHCDANIHLCHMGAMSLSGAVRLSFPTLITHLSMTVVNSNVCFSNTQWNSLKGVSHGEACRGCVRCPGRHGHCLFIRYRGLHTT